MCAFQVPRLSTAFSLDPARKRRDHKMHDAAHLKRIRTMPCCVCGSYVDVEAAHLRAGNPVYGKSSTGLGQRPADRWVTPLCARHHRTGPGAQHNGNEMAFWDRFNIDPHLLAQALYECGSDEDLMKIVVQASVVRAAKAPSRA